MSRTLRDQQCRQCEPNPLKEAFWARGVDCAISVNKKRESVKACQTSEIGFVGLALARPNCWERSPPRDRHHPLDSERPSWQFLFGISFRARLTCGTWGFPCDRWLAAGLLLACCLLASLLASLLARIISRIGGVVWAGSSHSCCDPPSVPPSQSLNLMSRRRVMKLSDRAVPVSAGRNDCRKWTEPSNWA